MAGDGGCNAGFLMLPPHLSDVLPVAMFLRESDVARAARPAASGGQTMIRCRR
jgi:hypothetical protein